MVRTVTKPGKYFDGHGLYLRVDPTGGKFWVQRIVINGKRCELGMGSVDFVTLADARLAAFGNRKLAREGGDPLGARRSSQEVLTFEEAARRSTRSTCRPGRTRSTATSSSTPWRLMPSRSSGTRERPM
ncbi:Arm DNA-binding domain-containing protein [Pseudomonas sp. GX19020]|uniref:Arm DNA-binding domain-containing protein n=1 Tax=Pseudomonas sp. GX19020 TaxID=2942277 RepID=UPI002019E937|nr:Arm DNA-binding domain-containing protein [Pseudomonas sp. GX19020]MCL4068334.1 Arm DNA-binding domain-containing protein [Pseudomonas sp. GX19020]